MGTYENLVKLEDEVESILNDNPKARGDGMALYSVYAYRKLKGKTDGLSMMRGFLLLFSDHRYRVTNGVAPFESVSRCRRKVQSRREDLRPTEEQVRKRAEAIAEYKKYARASR